MKVKTIWLIVLCALLLAPGLSLAFPEVGGQATDCTVETLGHEMISLSDYSDQIVVMFLLGVSDSRFTSKSRVWAGAPILGLCLPESGSARARHSLAAAIRGDIINSTKRREYSSLCCRTWL